MASDDDLCTRPAPLTCAPSESLVDPFDLLPNEMLDKVLTGQGERDGRVHLPVKWRWTAAAVCKRWRAAITKAVPLEGDSNVSGGMVTAIITKDLNIQRGRVASASTVCMLARSGCDASAIVHIFDGSQISPLDIAVAIAAADTVAATEQAQRLVDHADWEECGRLICMAARVGACLFVQHLIPRSLLHRRCDAMLIAARKDYDQIVRMLLEAMRCRLTGAFIRSLWLTVGLARAERTARLLLLCERDLKAKKSASHYGIWWTSRELSNWTESAARVGWSGALDICDQYGLSYSPRRLFAVAAMHGRHAFCQDIAERHPQCDTNTV